MTTVGSTTSTANNTTTQNSNNNDNPSVLSSTPSDTSYVKTKKGISYVLGDSSTNENHILPINSIQYSPLTSQLYTAGRDGNIKIWESNNLQEQPHSHPDSFPECLDLDEKILRLETSISSNPIAYKSLSKESTFSITKNHNLHFDWINDLQLINNDKNLISCSSDLSIKILDLFSLDGGDSSSAIHKLPNIHTDYIKKLSPFQSQPTIVSGGLDGRMVVWDLNQLKPLQTLENRATGSSITSIYSLANNNSNIISAGGPSNTINVFDKRTANPFIRNLIGHQDNIRCLLMNDKFILSGSSDTTIKLWDLRTFKVYKNFDIHDYSVWSLYSTDNEFKNFYSGDNDGNIVKTDLSRLFIHDKNNEFGYNPNENTVLDEKLGISTFVAKCSSPILSICHELKEDTLFATNYKSLDRFTIPDTSQLAQYQYLRHGLDYSVNRENAFPDDSLINDVQSNTQNDDLNSDFYDLISHLSMDTNPNNVDLQSTFSHSANPDGTPPTLDADDGEFNHESKDEYTSIFLNVNGGPSGEFINAYKDEEEGQRLQLQKNSSNDDEDRLDLTPVEILLNPIPAEQVTLVPFNMLPIEQYNLVPKSIVAKKMISDRRRIMVLYVNGDIELWDLLTCRVLQTFPNKGRSSFLSGKELEDRTRELEILVQSHQSKHTLNNWCEVEIKSGKLLVTIKESSFLNVEMYYDDLISLYPFLDINTLDNSSRFKKNKPEVSEDDRFYLGIIMLNSIFRDYALYEEDFDLQLREELKNMKLNSKPTDGNSASIKKLKYFGKKAPKIGASNQSSPSTSTNTSVIDFPTSNENGVSSVSDFISSTEDQYATTISDYGDTIMKLLQVNKKIYWDRYSAPNFKNNPSSKAVDSILHVDQITTLSSNGKDVDLRYYPIIASKFFPPDLTLRVFEYSSELGNYRDLCSFQFKDLSNLHKNYALVQDLRIILPRWIGQPILYNKHPVKESPKLTFQLTEVDYASLPPNIKIGGKSQKKIKKLPDVEGSIKLTSHNMLRVSKVLSYLTEKFESSTKEMKDKKLKPTDWLVLECKGQELTYDMTLQAIKTKIWKSSSDIELTFRRKYD
ncbi:WD repeat-containing protein 48 [Candida viswanathii]|uniref:WD repeat-containing protein 48 n=1 Tax=Candida viswanathii TaxID=5486 RepID=A0A367YBB9_9ASCO|nr:WD repeat-containing protein 48 [Candida viswanathii]